MSRRARWTASAVASSGVVLVVLGAVWLRVWSRGYELVGDTAVITLRAGDVFGKGTPLLGMPSAFSAWSQVADPMHPGPAAFWLLAPTEHLIGGATGALVGTFLIASLSAVWVVVAVTRRFGSLGAPAGATLVLATMVLGSFTIWEPLNPSMAVPVCVVLFVSVWAVLDGDDRAWPVLALSASVVVQLDLSFVPRTAVLVAVAVAATLWRWRRHPVTPGLCSARRRAVVQSGTVLVVMWALPAADAVVNGGGNVAEGLRAITAGVPVRGLPGATQVLVLVIGPAVVLAPLLVLAWRRDRPGRRALIMAGSASAFGAAVGQALVPAGEVDSLTWVPLAMGAVTVWFATALIAIDVAAGHRRDRHLLLSVVAWPLFAAVAVSALGRLPGAAPWGEQYFDAIRPMGAAVRGLPPGDYRFQPLSGPMGVAVVLGVLREVDGTQVHLHVDRPLARYVGADRRTTGYERRALYVTIDADRPPIAGADLLARWRSRGVDPDARRTLDGRVAEAVRADPLRWSPTSSTFFIGSIAAGGSGQPGRQTYRSVVDFGQRLRSGGQDVRALSDEVLAELVARDQLRLGPGHDALLEALQADREHPTVSVWVASDAHDG